MYRVILNFLVLFQYHLQQTSQSSIIIVDNQSGGDGGGCQPCYRKLFAGKRLAEIHIRRAINCERIEECSRECDSEKGFSCEGFNYRHAGGPRGPPSRGRSHGICELTAMQPSQIDIIQDILQEPRYDYYERDLGCQSKRPSSSPSGPRPPSQSGWHNLRPSSGYGEESYYPQRPIDVPRPLIPDRRPIDVPRPLIPDRRPIEIPRPLEYDYLPKRRYHGEQSQPQPPSRLPWRPSADDSYQRRIPSINIRPIEDDIRYEYNRPGRPYVSKDRRPDIWYRPNQHQHNDLGMNDIEPYDNQPGRRKDMINHGGVYGYNKNYIDGYETPLNNHNNRPSFDDKNIYNYASGFGYGENNNNREVTRNGNFEECSMRSGAGFKLRRGIIIKSYLTSTLDQCEKLCVAEKDCICMTFSYRYSLTANAPTDNCLLSEISYRDLDFYTDLEPDRDYDIYSITGDPKSCGIGRPTNQRPPEECFWRVRSGCGVPTEVVRKAIIAQGIGDCQAECVESELFTCRSFVYRYGGSIDDESANCFLSDWPSQEIDPLSLPEVDGAELYQRGSFGRGCEPSPFPPLNNHRRRPEIDDNRPLKKDEVCYAEYQKPCRLTPQAVMLTIYVNSEYECRESCSKMRERDAVPCMSFSYRLSSDRDEHNCFMSDVPHRDLRPGLDYIHGDGYILFSWKEFEPECDSGYSIGILIDDDDRDYVPKRPQDVYLERPSPASGFGHNSGRNPFINFGRPNDNNQYDDRRQFENGNYRPNDNFRPNNENFNQPGRRPLNTDRPDPQIDHDYGRPIDGGYGAGGYHDKDERYGHGYSEDRYNDFSHKYGGGSTFEHFTVNGRPCKRGTRCERNKVAGFWSCEPEGSEYGTWDYCCEPKHHCGYSQGYNYPWCYVGPYEDQWRPCSEKYYPYLPSHRPTRPSSDRYDVDDPYGEVPRPGFLGRHWPVAYLHREAPPNVTADSFDTQDGRRNRELKKAVSIRTANVITRGNYIVDQLDSESQLKSQSISSGNVRRLSSPKVQRLTTRFSESSGNISSLRNSTNDDALLRPKDSIDRQDKINRTAVTTGTTFIRLPTISANNSKETAGAGTSFEDYFEVVNVD